MVNFFRDVKMFLENSIWNLVARKVEKVLACFWVCWLMVLKLPIFHVKRTYTKCVCCVSGFRISKNANPNLILFQHQALLSVTGSWDHCSRWDCCNTRWTETYTSRGIKCLFFHALYMCYIFYRWHIDRERHRHSSILYIFIPYVYIYIYTCIDRHRHK